MKKLLFTLLFSVGISPLVYANEAVSTNNVTTEQQAQKEVNFYIKEMTCQLCVYLVNKELRAIDGVISTKANMKERKVKIIANEKVSTEQMIKAIEELGYTAEQI
ncbi:heavy-metal-associated domain-containing protein [Actinobacillus pleuropneumoniae]|uniref:Heavy-metal-associated domain-containing protein n=2 Tax=Actinobacillus pleuropneumoniae TaxID=715 RepID=A0A9Q4H847_ACTPL|nr:heavy-metal-associated domain-containing protein [Actinobacillus pleuropneumoniae]EFL80405.1 MerP [Actinobacillus pleuropneumoniae serovar 6 str. Femo]EFM91038.1 Possible MerTP family mercury (Hg2+) permease, binding protein MerP [Actinobacillus pleuropneumoniae serovar 6 str. Femo]MCL7721879.1 heavy-metal-associated domain-containing protein [Actinobacillus pleuropneumoniae]MCL7728309.1 heavy-metal-associated domain-containing protein [Actinobacillus pleuropneumoniae]MCL7729390.1 heavy-met